MVAREQMLVEKALTTGLVWSTPPSKGPEPPATMAAIEDAVVAGHKRVVDILRGLRDEQLVVRAAAPRGGLHPGRKPCVCTLRGEGASSRGGVP